MKKTMILLVVLLMASSVFAGTVTRSFGTTEATAGGPLEVSLDVVPSAGETYYAVDEVYPSGWQVIAVSSECSDNNGHIKCVVIQNAIPTVFRYSIAVPSTATSGLFSGTYAFEGGIETAIGGIGSITVTAAAQCSLTNLAACKTPQDCTTAGGDWLATDECKAKPVTQTPLQTFLDDVKVILQDTTTSTLSKISAIAGKLSAYFKAI